VVTAAPAEIAATAIVTTAMVAATMMATTVMMPGVRVTAVARHEAGDALPTRIAACLHEYHESGKHDQRDDESERPTAHDPSVSPHILVAVKTTATPPFIPRVETPRHLQRARSTISVTRQRLQTSCADLSGAA
jgi:hypothetical protein